MDITEEIRHILADGTEIGHGAKRTCVALPDADVCVKFARLDDGVKKGGVVWRNYYGRFSKRHSVTYREWKYLQTLKKHLPQDVMSAFPDRYDIGLHPEHGWVAVQSLVRDADGSQSSIVMDVCRRMRAEGRPMEERRALLNRFMEFIDRLADCGIWYRDQGNTVVQYDSNGGYRFRIIDFEIHGKILGVPSEQLMPRWYASARTRSEQKRMMSLMTAWLGLKGDTISLSFAISDNYAQHLAVVLSSILVNNPGENFVFHILHHNVSNESIRKVSTIREAYSNCEVKFHRIDPSVFDKFPLPAELEHVTKETYYRFLLPDVLSDEDRTIYSDVDVLCVAPIRELWETPLGDCLLAAQPEPKSDADWFKPYRRSIGLKDESSYCYAGLLVMDLKGIREGGYVHKLFENTIKLRDKIAWIDQDVINYTFQGSIVPLSPLWNWTEGYEFGNPRGVKIWHFPGQLMKPWCNIWKNVTWIPYLKYLRKSGYKDRVPGFVWGHIKGFFYFSYIKKRVKRILICGIRVYKKKLV